MKLKMTTLAAKAAGDIELSDDVFGLTPRKDLLHRMVRYQLAKRQAGTHKVKGRSEISLTGKRFGNQKGGGTARHGSRRSNIFVGGGRAFGPVVRSHAHGLQKKVRKLALRHALSAKAGAKELIIVDDVKAKSLKTKDLLSSFDKLGIKNALIVGGREMDENLARASRNIPNVDVLPSAGINVYDILRRHTLVLSKSAVEDLEARFK